MAVIPAGSLCFSGYGDSSPDAHPKFLTPAGAVIAKYPTSGFYPGEGDGWFDGGVCLPDGTTCINNAYAPDPPYYGFHVLDQDWNELGGSDEGQESIACNYSDAFYVLNRDFISGSYHYLVEKWSNAGTFVTSWEYLVGGFVFPGALGVAPDESVFYVNNSSGAFNHMVRKYDVGTATLSTFATHPTDSAGVCEPNGILVLPDATVVVAWRSYGIVRYATDGSVLNDYTIPDQSNFFGNLTPSYTSGHFWVNYYAVDSSFTNVAKFKASDGSIPVSFQISNSIDFYYDAPFFELAQDVAADDLGPPADPPPNQTCDTAICFNAVPSELTADVSAAITVGSDDKVVWYYTTATSEGTLKIDFTGTDYDIRVKIYKGTECDALNEFLSYDIDEASGDTFRFGLVVGETYYFKIYQVDGSGTTMTMTVTDDKWTSRYIEGVFTQGNTDTYLGVGNGIADSNFPTETAWEFDGDLHQVYTGEYQDYAGLKVWPETMVKDSQGHIFSTYLGASGSGSARVGIVMSNKDMGYMAPVYRPDLSFAMTKYSLGIAIDASDRLYTIQWRQTGPDVDARVTRYDPAFNWAEEELFTLDKDIYGPPSFCTPDIAVSADGEIIYIVTTDQTHSGSSENPNAGQGFLKMFSPDGTYLGDLLEVPSVHDATVIPYDDMQIIHGVWRHPVSGDFFIATMVSGGIASRDYNGGSLYRYNSAGIMLNNYAYFDWPFESFGSPYPTPSTHVVDGVCFDPDDPDLMYVTWRHVEADSGGFPVLPLGNLVHVQISDGTIVHDYAPHDYTYGPTIEVVGEGPTATLTCTFASNNSLTIRKHVLYRRADEPFEFVTTGGLDPSTFSLNDGEEIVFSDLVTGAYGVSEVVPEGWEPTYVVSNGDDHFAVFLEEADDVTIDVYNRWVASPLQPKQWRLFRFDTKLRKEERA